jgi:hypothetical protein
MTVTAPTAHHTAETQIVEVAGTIRIYPDAAHGFLFQYPAEVAADINAFLGDRT